MVDQEEEDEEGQGSEEDLCHTNQYYNQRRDWTNQYQCPQVGHSPLLRYSISSVRSMSIR